MPDSDPELRGRWVWKAMPWAKYTTCVVCGEMRHCYGKSPDRLVCLDCFTRDAATGKLQRRGKTGPRSGYTYKKRRRKSGMIQVVSAMRREGKVVGLIADELGLSDKTVRNYLAEARKAENCTAGPLPEPDDVPRKEDLGSCAILASEGMQG